MKILLVKPKARLQTIRSLNGLIFLEPLELAYIAAAVPNGHEVKILDLRLSQFPDMKLKREIRKYKPDAVGITGYTHEESKVILLSRMIKKIAPEVFLIVGGHHATVLPHDYNVDSIDAIVRGEGTAPFRAIIEAIANKTDIASIDRVLVPGKKFDLAGADKLPEYPELSTIPLPRRELYDYKSYRCIWPSYNHPAWTTIFPNVALVRTSFGCMMNCSFCVVPRLCRRRHLKRNPEDVANEIASLPAAHIYFCDDETFIEPKHAEEVALAIKKKNIKKRYFAWARTTTVNRNPELFRLWKDIGLDAVFLGFEAVTDEELKDISKQSTIADNEKAHRTLIEIGIAVQIGFMLRSDFEEKDFKRLMDYVTKMPQAQITFTVFTPSPGSEAWEKEKKEFIYNPYELHDCMHPLSRTKIPLKTFYKYFGALTKLAGKKNPLRSPKTKMTPKDIFRIIRAVSKYAKGLKSAHKDFRDDLMIK